VEDDRSRYLALLCEEYRSCSESGRRCNDNTYTSLQWGSAVIAILLAASLTQWHKHDSVVLLALLVIVPAIVSFTMFFWLGELARMRRIYDYICTLEEKAALLIDDGAWKERFVERWNAARGEFDNWFPTSPKIPADPVVFETWLKRLRESRAGAAHGNISWVFRARFGFFPAVILFSLALGNYYAFTSGASNRHLAWVVILVCWGWISSVVLLWLAIEIALDLDTQPAVRPSELTSIRRKLRHLAGRALGIGDWVQMAESEAEIDS